MVSVKAADWVTKGNGFLGSKKYEDALECFDRAIEIDPDYEGAWNNKGTTLSRMGKYEDAIKCYDRALKINPKYIPAWTNKSVELKELGNEIGGREQP